jgi:hypothetical protein
MIPFASHIAYHFFPESTRLAAQNLLDLFHANHSLVCVSILSPILLLLLLVLVIVARLIPFFVALLVFDSTCMGSYGIYV